MFRKTSMSFLVWLLLKPTFNLPLTDKINKSVEYSSTFESINNSLHQNPEELGEYFEGDLIIPKFARNGVVDEAFRWDKGIIPFEIKGSFPSKDKNMIHNAMNMYHKYTCIRPRTNTDQDYISITNYNSGCWSKVGKAGKRQEVNLQNPQCTTTLGTPIHELMHAAGFLHEQNRFERDDYITINWENIKNGRETNFIKAKRGIEQGYGVPYDFISVMHYSSTAFSSNGEPTIIAKDPKNIQNMGQRRGFSIGDIMKINAMYNCSEKTQQLNLTGETTELEVDYSNNSEINQNSLWQMFSSFFSIFDQK